MITDYSYETKLLIAQVSKLKQDKIELEKENESFKRRAYDLENEKVKLLKIIRDCEPQDKEQK